VVGDRAKWDPHRAWGGEGGKFFAPQLPSLVSSVAFGNASGVLASLRKVIEMVSVRTLDAYAAAVVAILVVVSAATDGAKVAVLVSRVIAVCKRKLGSILRSRCAQGNYSAAKNSIRCKLF